MSTKKSYKDHLSGQLFFEEVKHSLLIDKLPSSSEGFDELWQVEDSKPPQMEQSSIERYIDEQREQVFMLTDEVNFLREENTGLRRELNDISVKIESYEKIFQDYSSLVELNRALTKQLNGLMRAKEKESFQLRSIKAILNN